MISEEAQAFAFVPGFPQWDMESKESRYNSDRRKHSLAERLRMLPLFTVCPCFLRAQR